MRPPKFELNNHTIRLLLFVFVSTNVANAGLLDKVKNMFAVSDVPGTVTRNFIGHPIDDWAKDHGSIVNSQPSEWCSPKNHCQAYERGKHLYNRSEQTLIWTRDGKISLVKDSIYNIRHLGDLGDYAQLVEEYFTENEKPKFIYKVPEDKFSYNGFWPYKKGLVFVNAVCFPTVVGSKQKILSFRKCYVVKRTISDCSYDGAEESCGSVDAKVQRNDLAW